MLPSARAARITNSGIVTLRAIDEQVASSNSSDIVATASNNQTANDDQLTLITTTHKPVEGREQTEEEIRALEREVRFLSFGEDAILFYFRFDQSIFSHLGGASGERD